MIERARDTDAERPLLRVREGDRLVCRGPRRDAVHHPPPLPARENEQGLFMQED